MEARFRQKIIKNLIELLSGGGRHMFIIWYNQLAVII